MDEQKNSDSEVSNPAAPSFASEPIERESFPVTAWVVATLLVLVVAGALLVAERRRPAAVPTTLQTADAYASSLPLSQLAMSESGNLSGGKQTYLDGHVGNTGGRVVESVTVQVVFQNDVQLAPQIDTQPLRLIRTREPYIDTEPVSAEPIKPGDEREFRLIFDAVSDNWNQQMPEVRVIRVELR